MEGAVRGERARNRMVVLQRVTLADALFVHGKGDLKAGAGASVDLTRLVACLKDDPGRTAMIEGYTDSSGSVDYSFSFSQRRADAVKSYLLEQGIDERRLMALGKGESKPVAGNDAAIGRRQNRRVEVTVSPPVLQAELP